MTASEKLRLLIVLVLVFMYLAYRYGWIDKLKERRLKKQEAEAEQRQLAERKARRQQARKDKQEKKAQTAEILRQGVAGFRQTSYQAAGEIWCLEAPAQPGAEPVLLLHGFAGDKEGWADVGRRLIQGGYRPIAPDLPGFGQNAKNPNLSYDVTSQAKRIRALIQKMGLERLHVVGHSVGGSIAAALAYTQSVDVASLTLIEPFGVHVPYPSELDKMLESSRNPMVIANPAAYNNLLDFAFHQRPDIPAGIKKHRAEQAAKNRIFFLKVWKEIREGERANLLDLLLPEIKVRTLILQGAQSNVIHPKTAEVVQSVMRDAHPVLIEDCGHFPMIEQPRKTAEHILQFLGSTSA